MNPSAKRITLWVAIILGLFLLVYGLSYLGTQNTGQGGTLTEAPSDRDHGKGNPNAAVTLVEYSDFQCPACAAYYPVVKQVADAHPNDLRVIYRHYPLQQIHRNALPAAKTAVAASMQNKFWEMHDVLFNTQDQWAEDNRVEDRFLEYAQSLGLDVEKFKKDVRSDDARKRIERDGNSGNASGVRGTPSFYINGEKVELRASYDDFEQAIANAKNR